MVPGRARYAAAALAAAAGVLLHARPARADLLGDLAAPFQRALEGGSVGLAVGLVFVAGLVTSLTPCVYPMIVITVSVFGARKAKTRLEGAALSSAFVLGIAALFTPLGIVAALTGSVFGAALASPYVLAGLAVLFVALALSMFGAFELALPPALQNKLATVGGVGYRGAFALGLVSALIAAPCTGPVLTVLLAWVAASENVGIGALLLFVYALGLGLLFWVVGTFAIGLPKSGRWLEWVKSALGTVMIVMALYYVRDFLPVWGPEVRSTTWLAAALALVVLGLAAGAIHLSFHGTSTATRVRKSLGVLLTVVGACGAVGWLGALPPGARIAWMEDYASARALAQETARPLLVDFGASWCGACNELDRKTFSDPRVVAKAQDFVPVRVDLSPDRDTPEKRAVLASYAAVGLPLVVLHGRGGAEVSRITRFVEADELLRALEAVD